MAINDPVPDAVAQLEAGDRLPVEDAYQRQYDEREAQAYERNIALTITHQETPEEAACRLATGVDVSLESLARSADQASQLPQLREKLTNELKEPSVRGAVDTILKTVTGNVLSLDAIDQHLQAEAEGKPSPLAAKLKSTEVLKLLDPAGNTAEALAREQLKRDGTLPPELQDKVAGTIGTLAGLLTPMSTGKRGAKVATEVFTNSLFSNPATHAANIASNALTSTWAIAERTFAASWSALEYEATLGKHERSVYFGEAGAMLVGALHSSIDAVVAAGNALRTGEAPLGSIARELQAGGTAVPARQAYRYGPQGLRAVDRDLLQEGAVQQGHNYLHTVATLPTRALAAEDVAAKIVNHRMEKYAQAYRHAAESGDTSLANIKRI